VRDGEKSRVRPVVIAGPTAVGKTAVGIELAERLRGEIISADSMAVYRGMDIGTAKPTPEEKSRARFHLIDVVEPDEPFTVRDFAARAIQVVEDCLARGVYPLLVGGTGLYIRAVIDGLDIPEAGPDPELRERFAELAASEGNEALHERLSAVDPETAARLHPNDVKRVIRALEVYEITGLPMSRMHKRPKKGPNYPDAELFGLEMDRNRLYERIEARVDEQIRQGLVQEVAGLVEKGYNETLPSMQGLGYKEIIRYLRGEYDLETAVSLLKRDTRRFAKRQYTWFRADKRIRWVSVDNTDAVAVAETIVRQIRNGARGES
jgi:tRNA dimethylallyltransferase